MIPNYLAVLIPVLATLAGGWIVWRNKSSLRPWLSLSGGIVLGLVYFDLLPETFTAASEINVSTAWIGAIIVGTILLFHILDKLFDYHGHEGHGHEEDCHNKSHRDWNSWIRISGMSFHAFLDGLAIGGGFAASTRLGLLVTFALALHKLSDGMSIVTLIKHRHGHDRSRMLIGLAMITVLPILGLAIGTQIQPSSFLVAIFLAFLTGFFTHLSLSELLPEAHEGTPYHFGLALTVLGVFLMAVVSLVSGG